MSRNICILVAATLALAGCDMAGKQDAQYDDSRNPYYKKAQQDLETNPEAAINDYDAALGLNPKLTEAHYQLGHIYADKLSDPIGSIFHFEQYLKLAPTGSHAAEAKALIDKQSQAFAASLPNSAPQSADEYAKLQTDNASLHKQLEDATRTIVRLQGQLGKHHKDAIAATAPAPAPAADTNAPAATPPAPTAATPAEPGTAPAAPVVATADATTNAAPAVPPRALPLDSTNALTATPPGTPGAPAAPAADAGPSRSYKIVSGDSLWKIAHKMYPGDTKNGIDKIKEANKEVLIEGKPLKIGQVLVIPQ